MSRTRSRTPARGNDLWGLLGGAAVILCLFLLMALR
jgi:hypothetical protein